MTTQQERSVIDDAWAAYIFALKSDAANHSTATADAIRDTLAAVRDASAHIAALKADAANHSIADAIHNTLAVVRDAYRARRNRKK